MRRRFAIDQTNPGASRLDCRTIPSSPSTSSCCSRRARSCSQGRRSGSGTNARRSRRVIVDADAAARATIRSIRTFRSSAGRHTAPRKSEVARRQRLHARPREREAASRRAAQGLDRPPTASASRHGYGPAPSRRSRPLSSARRPVNVTSLAAAAATSNATGARGPLALSTGLHAQQRLPLADPQPALFRSFRDGVRHLPRLAMVAFGVASPRHPRHPRRCARARSGRSIRPSWKIARRPVKYPASRHPARQPPGELTEAQQKWGTRARRAGTAVEPSVDGVKRFFGYLESNAYKMLLRGLLSSTQLHAVPRLAAAPPSSSRRCCASSPRKTPTR